MQFLSTLVPNKILKEEFTFLRCLPCLISFYKVGVLVCLVSHRDDGEEFLPFLGVMILFSNPSLPIFRVATWLCI